MTCWPPFSRQRNKASGQLCVCNGVPFCGRYNGGVGLQNSNRRNDVRHYRLVHSRPSRLRRLSSNLAYITSVFIGYIGTLTDHYSLIKRFAASAGGSMVEINNQRKAFLDMLAWSEGIDNGRQKTRTGRL